MESIVRSSEFWVAIIVALGVAGSNWGLWNAADFDSIVKPALTYVAARLISKLAKSVGVAPAAK